MVGHELRAYQDGKELYERMTSADGKILDDAFRERLMKSLWTITSALRLYGPEKISIAFNGGKDATVILHLYRAAVASFVSDEVDRERAASTRSGEEDGAVPAGRQQESKKLDEARYGDVGKAERARVLSLYIVQPQEFPQVESFVRQMCDDYAIDAHYFYLPFKDSLDQFMGGKAEIQAFVLGTRYDDPDGENLEQFSPSSPDWPTFMRINPLLEWDYHDVWQFLRAFQLPFCSLYNEGYTSLGSVDNTTRNPLLRNEDGSYQPAHALKHKSMERAGRRKKGEKVEETEIVQRSAALIVVICDFGDLRRAHSSYRQTSELLQNHGIRLETVCIVREEETERLVTEMERFSREFDLVFTAGGLHVKNGSHALVNAISTVFDEQLAPNEKLRELVRSNSSINALDSEHVPNVEFAEDDLCELPEKTQLLQARAELVDKDGPRNAETTTIPLTSPVLKSHNIYSLPLTSNLFFTTLRSILEAL